MLKYVKSQRSYGFLIRKELIFGFQILDFKDHFSASLSIHMSTVANFANVCTPPEKETRRMDVLKAGADLEHFDNVHQSLLHSVPY